MNIRSLASLFVVFERTNILTAIGPSHRALTIFQAKLKCTSVYAAVSKAVSTSSLKGVVFEFANVLATVRIGVGTLTVLPIFPERTNVSFTIWPGFLTLTRFYVIYEVPDIYAAVTKGVRAAPGLCVCLKVSNVFMTR